MILAPGGLDGVPLTAVDLHHDALVRPAEVDALHAVRQRRALRDGRRDPMGPQDELDEEVLELRLRGWSLGVDVELPADASAALAPASKLPREGSGSTSRLRSMALKSRVNSSSPQLPATSTTAHSSATTAMP